MSINLTLSPLSSCVKIGFIIATCLIGQSAMATGEETHGITTCYLFKNDKLIKKSQCSYKGLEFGSIRYNELSSTFTIKGHGKITTSSSSSAKTDKKGEIIDKGDGNIPYNSSITINDKPAISFYRSLQSFNIISQATVQKMANTKGLLSCMRTKNKSIEICTPADSGTI